MKQMQYLNPIPALFVIIMTVFSFPGYTQTAGKPLVLQEMTWPEVKEYLSQSDMVIIPMGSTEQHGPHLPLGTDYITAFDLAGQISAKTGVIVAPVLMSGYSKYHSGFPGTLSLGPSTMEQVMIETVMYLRKSGFRRLMLLNIHGGNTATVARIIERINQETEAIAISISEGGPVVNSAPFDSMDYHAGVSETSLMLWLHPELVRMDKIEKPEMHFTPEVLELINRSEANNQLASVYDLMLFVPEQTGKGGSVSELSSNGAMTLKDPHQATKELGQALAENIVNSAVTFIEAWKGSVNGFHQTYTTPESINAGVANKFIDAFYSFNSDSLKSMLSHAGGSQKSILYYQKWAECGNYQIIRRNDPIVKNATSVVCPVTVKDDLIGALQLGIHVTDTFHLDIVDGNIRRVSNTSNDPEMFHEAKAWVKQHRPDLIKVPCKGIWEDGKTPCECIRAMVEGFREYRKVHQRR